MFDYEIRKIKLTTGDKAGDFVSSNFHESLSFKEFYYRSLCVILDNFHAIVNELDFALKEIFGVDILDQFKGEEEAFEKWKIWRTEIKAIPHYKSSKKELRRDVKTALLKRNKYIHGTLHFINNEPFLTYNEKDDKGDTNQLDDSISKEYIINDIEFMKKTKDFLRQLNTELNRERHTKK